jgi:hypothetical protein
MSTNLYFNHFGARNEQSLYEELVGEVIQIYGIDSYYLPRTSHSSFDFIFGDDPTKKYSEAYPVEMYIKNVDEFEGGDLFSKFGIEVRKQVRLVVANRAFKKMIPSTYTRPREGDLVWLTNFRALFEIKFVNEENFFYAFGSDQLYGYELICEKFRYNDEQMEVGITEIEEKMDEVITAYAYTMQANGTSTYIISEQVYQGANLASASATADVVRWDKPTRILELKNIKGIFSTNSNIIGITSGASWNVAATDVLTDMNMPQNDNLAIQEEAETFISFSESNPFGDP